MDAALNKGAHLPQHTRQQIQREDLEFFDQVTLHDAAGMGTQETHSGNKNHKKQVLKDKFNQMYFVLLYSAANPPLKKTRRIMGQVSFHKKFWDRYWGRAIQLKGRLSRSQKTKNKTKNSTIPCNLLRIGERT